MTKSNFFTLTLVSLFCLFAVSSHTAHAAGLGESRFEGSGDRDSAQGVHSLSVAGGIASPSSTGFFGENPSGLIYNRRGSLLGYASTGGSQGNLLGNGASLMVGNGQAAATIGAQTFSNTTDERGTITHFTFGMATHAEILNTTFGLSGAYRFGSKATAVDPAQGPTWTADLGLLFNPFGALQVGAKVYNLSKGVTAAGIGVAAHVNSVSILAVDASTNSHGRGLTIKPGLGVRAAALSLSYSYGIQVDKDASSGLSPGNTIGIGYNFTPQFRVMGFYNHFTQYYLGATIDLF